MVYRGAGNKLGRLDPVSGKIKEYNIPYDFSAASELTIDKNGNIWFTSKRDFKLIKFISSSETFKDFPLPSRGVVEGLTSDKNGMIWFSERYGRRIVRFNPTTAVFTEIDMPLKDIKLIDIVVDREEMSGLQRQQIIR